MSFNWQELIRQFWLQSTRKSLRMPSFNRRARRRSDCLLSVENLEARIVLDATPTLTVVLSSQSISESAVGSAVTATVQRDGADVSQSLTVSLQSSDITEATVPASIVIPAGATSATFTVSAVDDKLLDGSQTVQISASAPGFSYQSQFDVAPVGLDPAFGTAGYSTTPLRWSLSNVIPDLLIQPDGAIVSISQSPSSDTSWTLTRKTASGAVDTSFGSSGSGIVATNFSGSGFASPTALSLQSNGKILAAGIVGNGSLNGNDLAIVRYNANGSLDSSFGIKRIEVADRNLDVHDMVILANGSIVLAGGSTDSSFLVKLSSTGALDNTFGTNGIVMTTIPGFDLSAFNSLAVQSDGKIVAAGSAIQSSNSTGFLSVARYLPNGTLDTSYDVDGMQQIDSNSAALSYGNVRSIALQSDGKVVIAGNDEFDSIGNEDWVIARLNVDGSLDSSFSSNGLTKLDWAGSNDYANDLILQADGKLLVLGAGFNSPNGRDLAVARFNTDGSLDVTFNGTGKLLLPSWSATVFESIWAGQLNSSGQLVFLAGYGSDMRVGQLNIGQVLPHPAHDSLTVTDSETLTVSVPAKSIAEDSGVPLMGTVTRSNSDDLSQPLTVNLQSSDISEATVPVSVVIPAGAASAIFAISVVDDNLLDGNQTVQITASAAGYVYSSIAPFGTVSLDAAFGTGGYATTPLFWSMSGVFPDVLIQPDGAIVSIAQVSDFDTRWRLTRTTASGAADLTFGNAGTVTTAFSNTIIAGATALALQSDGKILAVGSLFGGVTNAVDLTVVRYNTDGSLDDTFGSGGILRVESTNNVNIYDLKVLSDGSILLAGEQNNTSFLAKISASGVFDSSFGTGGMVVTTVPGSENSSFKSLSIQSDGTIVAAGNAKLSGGGNTAVLSVVRYLANGMLDTTYDYDGMQQVDSNPDALSLGIVRSAALQADGKLVLAGIDRDLVSGNDNWIISRLNVDGSLDTTFSSNGLTSVDFNGQADDANDIVIQADGKLVVMGYAFLSGTGFDLAVARINTDGTLDTTFDGDGKIILPAWPGTTYERIWAGALNSDGQLVFLAGYGADMRVGLLNLTGIQTARDVLTITDNDANAAPVVKSKTVSTLEDTVVNGVLTGTDADGNALTFSAASNADHGQVTVNANGSFSYQPAANFYGTDTFLYRAYDGKVYSNVGIVTITVQAVNDAPVANPNNYVLNEDQVLITSAHRQSASRIQMISDPGDWIGGGGTYDLTGQNGTLLAFASPSYDLVRVIYQNSDSYWDFTFASPETNTPLTVGTYTGAVRYPLNPAGTPGMEVIGRNHSSNILTGTFAIQSISFSASGALQSFYATFEQHSEGAVPALRGTIQYDPSLDVLPGVLPNDTDVEGDVLSAVLVTGPAHGNVVLNSDGSFRYTPVPNYYGPDTFIYRASDGSLLSDPMVVFLTVKSVEDVPSIQDQSFSVLEGSQNGTVVGKVVANDGDAGQTLRYEMTSTSLPGALVIDGLTGQISVVNGSLLNYSQASTITMTVTVTDNGSPASSSSATVTIAVASSNVAPVLTTDLHSVTENAANGTVVGMAVASDANIGQALTYAISGGNTDNAFMIDAVTGIVKVNNSAALDFETTPAFVLTITATDNGFPALSASRIVTVNLDDENDSPRFTVVSPTWSITENSVLGTVVGQNKANDQDAGQVLTYAITAGNTNSAFSIDNMGTIQVANPAALNFDVLKTFTLTITATDNGSPVKVATTSVTIAVTDFNEAPAVTPATFNIYENSVNGTLLGTVSATDPNAGQVRTFAITDGNTNNAFVIDALTGQLRVSNAAMLDFESTPSFNLTVTATDNGTPALSASSLVKINVMNSNDVPVFASSTASFVVAENSPVDTLVGQNVATDQDPGQTLSYAIIAGNINNAFAIDNMGKIRVANPAALNYEPVRLFTLTISATDNGSPAKIATARVSIAVTDVNEVPVVTPATFNVNENSVNGIFLGTVIAADPDVGQVRTFAIADGNTNNAFVIDSKTGQLKVNNAAMLDFETTPSFVLTVTATDNGTPALSSSGLITINVKDVNELPVFASSTASFTVAENSPVDTLVGQNAASDQDLGQVVSYAITAGNTNNAFAIDSTGRIRVANPAALNYEGVRLFTLTISATDNGSPAKIATARVSIAVTDVNEVPVVTPATFNVNENSVNGIFLGTVIAVDPDVGQVRTFAIADGNTNNAFVIDSKTGQLKVNNAAMLDFETTPSFVLTVTATDNGTPALSSSGLITINVKDMNELPVFASNTASFTVAENSPVDTLVGQNAASDQDLGQVVSYAITAGNTNNAFAIDSTGEIRVANPAALNFELVKVFTLTITATDNGTPAKVAITRVSIAVSNVNEVPVVTPATFSLNENSPIGVYFGTVTATDPDVGQVRTFTITDGNTNNAFVIDPATGQLRVSNTSAIDFEAQTSFLLTVTATDNGTPALSASGLITINVKDVNDLPVFASTTASFTIAENSPIGTLVGQNNASDQDAGQTVAYAITAGNINGAFSIDNAGTIRVANPAALNFESLKSFNLTISATDNGSPAKVATTSVAIAVTDVNEAPVVTSTTLTINENFPSGVAFGNVVATDSDAGQTRTFAITGGNTNNAFTIDPATGQLKVSNSAALDFETTPLFSLTITVTDNATVPKSGSGVVTVKLLNLNELPVIAPQSLAVMTKSTVGAVVGTVVASDPDVGQTLTFAIVLGNGTAPNDHFTIDPVTGEITVKTAASVSTDKVYTLIVRVTENGTSARWTQANIRIYVNATGIAPAGV